MIDKLITIRNKKINTSSYEVNKLALALCAERMTLLYTYFCKEYQLNEDWYTKMLNVIFNKEDIDINSSIKFIEKKVPDSEDFPELWATQAQCSVLCLLKVYDFINEKDYYHLESGYEFMDETIDLYCQEANEIGEEEHKAKKIFIAELNWQLDIFEKLTHENIKNIRAENRKHMIPTYPEVFK